MIQKHCGWVLRKISGVHMSHHTEDDSLWHQQAKFISHLLSDIQQCYFTGVTHDQRTQSWFLNWNVKVKFIVWICIVMVQNFKKIDKWSRKSLWFWKIWQRWRWDYGGRFRDAVEDDTPELNYCFWSGGVAHHTLTAEVSQPSSRHSDNVWQKQKRARVEHV